MNKAALDEGRYRPTTTVVLRESHTFSSDDIPPTDHAVVITPISGTESVVSEVRSGEERPDYLTVIDLTPTPGTDLELPEWARSFSRSPHDLTGASVELSKSFDSTINPTFLYIEGLDVFLQYVELDVLFRFLHVVIGQAKAVGADVVASMMRGTTDEQTVATLSQLFDDRLD